MPLIDSKLNIGMWRVWVKNGPFRISKWKLKSWVELNFTKCSKSRSTLRAKKENGWHGKGRNLENRIHC